MNLTKYAICAVASSILFSCGTTKTSGHSSKKDYSRTEVSVSSASDTASRKPSKGSSLAYIGINNLEKQLYGEWNILTINNKKVSTRERAYIHLDFINHRLYGNNGCNVINGDFSANANKISFSNIITTMMACHNATSEKVVMKALDDAASFKLLEKNKITYLHILNSRGSTIMTLRRQNLDFINGAWTVKEIDGTPTIDKEVRLVIDTEQLKIHGSTGCNIVNGTIYIDTDKNDAVQFQQLISTRKMCENMKTETALLVALEETCFCQKVSDNEIKLINDKGEVMVVLSRLNLSQDD